MLLHSSHFCLSFNGMTLWYHQNAWSYRPSFKPRRAPGTERGCFSLATKRHSSSICICMSFIAYVNATWLPSPNGKSMADVPRDRSICAVFSCWKGSGRDKTVGESVVQNCDVFDVISPFKDSCPWYIWLLVIADSKTVRMTIIVFLVDTSASMNQRTYMGTTILDATKGAVETFMKVNLWFPRLKWSVFQRVIILCCRVNWKFWHFRLDREIRTVDGIVTCCWHSTNRRRTSEWVDLRPFSVDFVTYKCSLRYMDVYARFMWCLYRRVDAVIATTTKNRENKSFPLLYAIFAFIVGWAGPLAGAGRWAALAGGRWLSVLMRRAVRRPCEGILSWGLCLRCPKWDFHFGIDIVFFLSFTTSVYFVHPSLILFVLHEYEWMNEVVMFIIVCNAVKVVILSKFWLQLLMLIA